ncbi:Dabb family protein [Maritalea sp.]|uniref:Dabb family protein n=1 Tax=Maritalea sp. TaxID=2003361 RepID=UPI003EF42251
MILHCVFCDFRDDVDAAEQQAILSELSEFSRGLDGVEKFDFGPNRDFEQKSLAFNAGFVIHFSNKAALEAYAIHPTHQALGGRLCDLCNNGANGIIVFDLDVAS